MHRFTGRPSPSQTIRRALIAGVSAGLRSATPLGVMAAERNDASFRAGWKDWPLLRSSIGRATLQIGWAGEIVTDKLPSIPPRTEPGPLAGRMTAGAIAGLAMGSEATGGAAKAASLVAGIGGALAGAYGGTAYRTRVAKATGLPDLPLALLEDFVAYVLARKAVKG